MELADKRTSSFTHRTSPWGVIVALALMAGPALQVDAQDDWARWRGPTGNGVAAKNQKPPTQWTSDDDFAWKVEVPGRGHSSPIIVDDKIFLTTADTDSATQSVLCYDRKNGKKLWQKEISTGGFRQGIHRNNSYASPSVATDRESIFVTFSHHEQIELVSLSLGGEENWRKIVGAYKPKFDFGYGASPIVYQDNVIVSNENISEGGVYAFNKKTGEQVWKIDRGTTTSWSTPVVTPLDGKDQLLLSGGETVKGYDATNGNELWSVPASWAVSCGTMVWDGDRVFASGGYPTRQTIAVDVKQKKQTWTNGVKSYEQSMLVHDGYLYAIDENGVVYCWQTKDGTEKWKGRVAKGRFSTSASPLLANGNIYIAGENGQVLVLEATPTKMKKIATSQLGTSVFASFAICGNQIFARYGDKSSGEYQEYLSCIGEK